MTSHSSRHTEPPAPAEPAVRTPQATPPPPRTGRFRRAIARAAAASRAAHGASVPF